MKNEELINVKSYHQFCDFIWDGPKMDEIPPDGSIVFVHGDNIKRFLIQCCYPQSSNRYILISAESDFGLHEQAEYHPNMDLRKLVGYLPFDRAASDRTGYVQIPIGPACKKENCNITDKYSWKTFNWTLSTFTNVPSNILYWFVANLNIVHPKVEWLPFGLAENTKLPLGLRGSAKRKLLYINFELYTDERTMLKKHYANTTNYTYIPEANLPQNKYLQDIAEHKFVLCPEGNGLDCYRNYETLYLGSIPVMKRNKFSENFEKAGLPIVLIDSLFNIRPDFLENNYKKINGHKTYLPDFFDYSKINLSYWKNRIEQIKKELL